MQRCEGFVSSGLGDSVYVHEQLARMLKEQVLQEMQMVKQENDILVGLVEHIAQLEGTVKRLTDWFRKM